MAATTRIARKPSKHFEGELGPDAQVREEQILEVAARLFKERGYRGTALQDIAAEVGVTRTAVYYYFPNKEALLYRILDKTIIDSAANFDTIVKSDAPPEQKMRSLVRHYILSAIRIAPSWWVLLTEGEHNLPLRKYRRLHRHLRQLDETMQQVFQQSVQAGKFAPLNPKIAVFTIASVGNWLPRWYDPAGEVNPEALADTVLRILEHGYQLPGV